MHIATLNDRFKHCHEIKKKLESPRPSEKEIVEFSFLDGGSDELEEKFGEGIISLVKKEQLGL
jgi:hypothetical protein